MKITQILGARAARFIALSGVPYFVPDVVRLIQHHYRFVQLPQTAEELLAPLDPDTNRPLTFLHGKFEHNGRAIVIERLQIFRNLIAVDTSATTDDGDVVLDHLVGLSPDPALRQRSLQRRMYISQLEATLEAPLETLLPSIDQLGAALATMMNRYLDEAAPVVPFRLAGIGLVTDPGERVLPADFRVERRQGAHFDTNLYFAQAPLRTDDHGVALQQFEDILRTASRVAALGR